MEGSVEEVDTGNLAHFRSVEELIGFRVSPEITIRGGHRARETFGRSTFVHAAEVSIVWSKRWF